MLSAHSPNFVYKTYETLLPTNNHPTSHSIEETNFSSLKNEWWNYSWAANNDPDSVDIQYIEIDNAKKNLIITPPETPQVVGKCIHGSQSLKCEECSKLNKCPHGRKVNIKVLLLKDKRIFFSQVVVKDVVVHQTVNITAKGQFAELAKVAQFVNMGREEVIAVNAVNSGGTSICEHDRRRYECRQCNGKGICEHQRVRSTCKECGGSRICPHRKLKQTCKECCGSSICQHMKYRSSCKVCLATDTNCIHGKERVICELGCSTKINDIKSKTLVSFDTSNLNIQDTKVESDNINLTTYS